MLPKSLVLVDDDRDHADHLARCFQQLGVAVHSFADGGALLADPSAFQHDFYVLDLMLPTVQGVDLLKVLRLRTDVGVLVISGQLGEGVFKKVVDAGADMYLSKPVQCEQVEAAVRAVQRRVVKTPANDMPWKLDRRAGELLVPDGARVSLSEMDMAVLECFIGAQNEPVTRDVLNRRIGQTEGEDASDGLNATIYRLRRRIERATPMLVPLQSKSRVGYVFKAPLVPI